MNSAVVQQIIAGLFAVASAVLAAWAKTFFERRANRANRAAPPTTSGDDRTDALP